MARLLLLPALLVLVALTGSGCPPNAIVPDAGAPECLTRADCEGGMACTNEGRCGPCESSGQCLLREDCNPEVLFCELKPDWGNDCTRNEECALGQWCRQGLCKDRDQVRLCPTGQATECLPRERCNTLTLVCEEDLGCAEEADCGEQETCNPGNRKCVPSCTVETQGDVCEASELCHEERCVQCVQDGDCGPQLHCDEAGLCVETPRCYSDRDCKVPLVCHRPTGACLEKPPACSSDESCLEEERCDLGTGRCVPRACQPDRYEANNAREQATAVVANGFVYEALTLCASDVDLFSVTLARGDRLGALLDADPYSEATFSTLIQDSSGRTLASGRLSASYVAPADGTYYVGVATTDDFQAYDIRFLLSRGTPCDDFGAEPNDTPALATALNAARVVDGVVCPQDADHFSVTSGGGTFTARLVNYSSSSGLLQLCVFPGAAGPTCTEALEAPVVGVSVGGGTGVVVRVQGAGDQVSNAYTLEVEVP
ncbi:MAG: hypothetical protein L0Y66_00845 [Myxococcaceae bacterium]|nr:hypothetical protein [Myxococcaceae bacterium]